MSHVQNLYHRYQRFFVIFGGFILNLTIGNLYTYNNMAPNIVAYMNSYSKEKNNSVTEGNAVWIFGMGVFGMGSSLTLGSYFVNRIGPSLTVLIAGWLMSLTVVLMSSTLKTYLWVVAITYGFINGVATGIVYGVTIDTGCNWFPERKGTAAGMIVAGFGLSAFVIDLCQQAFLQAYNDPNGVPLSYIVLGCTFFLLQFCGSMLLKNPPLEDVESVSTKCTSDLLESSKEEQLSINITPHKVLMELDFWIMWLTYTLLSACFAIIISLHKGFGLVLGLGGADWTLSSASSLGSLCNALGRLFWGYVIDRVRYKIVILIITLGLAILLATFFIPIWVRDLPGSAKYFNTKVFYFIWVMGLYLLPSGMFAIYPYMCSKLFGQVNFIANYGLLFSAYSIGGVITSCITTYIWYGEKNVEGLYRSAFISGAVMAVVAAMVTLLYRGRSLIRLSGFM